MKRNDLESLPNQNREYDKSELRIAFCARLLEDSHPHEYDKSELRIAGLCPPPRGQPPREYDKSELRIAILRPPPRGEPLGKAPATEQLCS